VNKKYTLFDSAHLYVTKTGAAVPYGPLGDGMPFCENLGVQLQYK